MPLPPTPAHFTLAAKAARQGKLTVFLGAGANFAQRPTQRAYTALADYLPTGAELSRLIATRFGYAPPDYVQKALDQACANAPCDSNGALRKLLRGAFEDDLGKVSQQVKSAQSRGVLESELYDIFKRDYPLTPLHRVLASTAAACEPNVRPVFITTNYDTMVEQALAAAGEPFDVIYYRAPGPENPVWLYHWKHAERFYSAPFGKRKDPDPDVPDCDCPIADLATYADLPLGGKGRHDDPSLTDESRARSLVVKIHGTVSPRGWEESSLIISPDDYVQFLRIVSLNTPLPTPLVQRLLGTHFLFLGYGLGDWNILAICQNLWNQRKVSSYGNWAVQRAPSPDDVRRWAVAGPSSSIEIFDQDVGDYAAALEQQLPPP